MNQVEQHAGKADTDQGRDRRIPISIDKEHFQISVTRMTGAELRALPNPDVPADRDLWLEMPGPKDDVLITPEKEVDLKPGMHFYTAPRTINPGR